MTLRIPDCPVCGNKGYRQIVSFCFGVEDKIEEVDCHCSYGQERIRLKAYFARRSPQQIIDEIELIAASKEYLDANNKSIDQEFNP